MNCKIVGYEFKHLEIELSPGEDFYGERGAFVYCDEGIDKQTEIIGTSISGVLLSKLSGESLLLVHYRNVSSSNRILVVAGSHANLLPLKLSGSDTLLIRRGAYVASSSRMKIDSNIFRGEGLSTIKITGPGKVHLSPLSIVNSPNTR